MISIIHAHDTHVRVYACVTLLQPKGVSLVEWAAGHMRNCSSHMPSEGPGAQPHDKVGHPSLLSCLRLREPVAAISQLLTTPISSDGDHGWGAGGTHPGKAESPDVRESTCIPNVTRIPHETEQPQRSDRVNRRATTKAGDSM